MCNLWQRIAQIFYPQRADFTTDRTPGRELLEGLATSSTILVSRELAQLMPSMLRQKGTDWFNMGLPETPIDKLSIEARRWLESSTKKMRRLIYVSGSNFVKAMGQTDADFINFGNACVSCEIDWRTNKLLFRNWHLRDVAWTEKYDGQVGDIFRKCETSLAALNTEFDGNISQELKNQLEKDREKRVKYCHAVVESEHYQGKRDYSTPYVSVYFEEQTGHVLREGGSFTQIYAIPRWQTVSGTGYGYSPAVVAALPDGRLIQEVADTIIEAGQKAVAPPYIATQDAIVSEINLHSRGITFVDSEYDEKRGDPLRPLQIDKSGLQFGLEMHDRTYEQLKQAFYTDRIRMIPPDKQMTLGEAQMHQADYIRNSTPFFESVESNYTALVIDLTFQTIVNARGLDFDAMPQELEGRDIEFTFTSPITQAQEELEARATLEGIGTVGQMASVYPEAVQLFKGDKATRQVLLGHGVSPDLLLSEAEMEEAQQQQRQQEETAQLLANIQQGGEAAQAVGAGLQALQGGGVA